MMRWFAPVLIAALVALGLVEIAARELPLVLVPLALGLPPLFLLRARAPLIAFLVGFGAVHVFELANVDLGDVGFPASVLLLVYAVFRNADLKSRVAASTVMILIYLVDALTHPMSIGDRLGGALVFAMPAVIGLALRHRTAMNARALDDARHHERERLARELHDTVAHHMSAIAITAQSGLAVPDAAQSALQSIESSSKAALTELRLLVGALRTDEADARVPQLTLDALESLSGGPLDVVVVREGELDALPAATSGGLARIAREALTNARRHAKNASRVTITVRGNARDIELLVEDDGERVTHRAPGHGVVGMEERARLLGGELSAGPGSEVTKSLRTRGWVVHAKVPRA